MVAYVCHSKISNCFSIFVYFFVYSFFSLAIFFDSILSHTHANLTLGGGGAVLWGINLCSPSLESVGSSAGRACLGLRPEGLPCPGPVRSPVDFLVFGFLEDWRIASSKEGGSWYGGRVLKSLCGPLAGYAEFISSSPVLCARRPFLAKREPGLSSTSGCWTESEGRKKVLFAFDETK